MILSMRKQIAIVEDEPALRENYSAALARQGYQVKSYANRRTAIQSFTAHLPDLAIIDISLENEAEGGFDLCRELRALSAAIPIIFLTARDSELDAVSGLRLGADDFITKDISLPHLAARVAALFRRIDALLRPDNAAQIVRRGPLSIDGEKMQTSWNGIAVTLSLTDYLADYPDAMIHVHNLGGNIPYEVERMDHRCLLDTPQEELPSSRFRKAKVYVDCNSFGPHAIEAAVRLYGAERIVCGTDGTEFGCDWTRKALEEAQIGEAAREQILHRNAAAMLTRVANTAQRERDTA